MELSSLEAAIAVVTYYHTHPAQIHGWEVVVDYSTRSHITRQHAGAPPSPVLLVSISTPVYPMTIELIHQVSRARMSVFVCVAFVVLTERRVVRAQVFSQYGDVRKAILFERGGEMRFLVEMGSIASATRAVGALQGQCIYTGTNVMHLQYSSNQRLQVKYNNMYMRDFTNPTLPSRDGGTLARGMPAGPRGYLAPATAPTPYSGCVGGQSVPACCAWQAISFARVCHVRSGYEHAHPAATPGDNASTMGTVSPTPVIIVSGFEAGKVTCDTLFKLCGVYGDVVRQCGLAKHHVTH